MMRRAHRVGIALSLALSFATRVSADDGGHDPRRLVGRRAPPVTATDVAGDRPVSLADLRGRVVVLYFFSTWCLVCAEGSRRLGELERETAHGRPVVLGISREPVARLGTAVEQDVFPHAVAVDDGATFRRYGVRLLPTVVVIDRTGIVRDVVIGSSERNFRRIEDRVHALLDR